MDVTALDEIDIVLLEQTQVDGFIDMLGKRLDADSVPTVFTDDDLTRGSVEFNLITQCEDGHGVATQLRDPIESTDTVLDLRCDPPTDFSEYVMGLP